MEPPLAAAVAAAFGQAAFTLWTIVAMGRARVRAIRHGRARLAEVATDTRAYPREVLALAANAHNQFETPILFFAAIGLAAALEGAGWAFAAAAWGYLATRLGHRWIQVGENDVVRRFYVFSAGLSALALMWILLGIELLS